VTPTSYGPATLAAVDDIVIGRRREIELVVAALMAGRHLLLEGPPGTGKSTILRSVAEASRQPFSFVEGNAELTPARLAGHFDPAQVLQTGYREDVWVDGPLAEAMRTGGLLYVEEINRVPEETLNVLVTVMSEGELTVPRLGTIAAAPGFRLVAAMNPFDAIGTGRISGAVYDRVCRVAMGYQSADDEASIARSACGNQWPATYLDGVINVVRDTRQHSDLASGSSVRGAIDLLLLCRDLATLRESQPTDFAVGHDAALTALSGRVRVADASTATADEIIGEIWHRHMATAETEQVGPDTSAKESPSPAGKDRSRRPAAPTPNEF
jgi:MoxR-like ATPase